MAKVRILSEAQGKKVFYDVQKATKAHQKLNFEKENGKRYTIIETEKLTQEELDTIVSKYADKPIPVPWYGQKDDGRRAF